MRKFKVALTTVALVFGAMAVTASADTRVPNASQLPTLLKNMSPIVTQVACNGRTGRCGCGAGYRSSCSNRCCRCVPC
jgi:hypothetical protein